MSAADVIIAALERNWGMVNRALDGLDDDILVRQPNEESNSIAWLLWHMNRYMDLVIHERMQAISQIWVRDKWYEKFGMDDDPGNTGAGWTPKQLSEWKAPLQELLLSYCQEVQSAAKEHLSTLTPSDLEGSITIPSSEEPRPVADILGVLILDNVAHGGQIAYLRGYFKGMGWFV